MFQVTNNFLQQKFSPAIVDHFPHRIVDHHISKIVTKNIFVCLFIYFNFMWIKIVHIDQALSGEACYRTCYSTCRHPHTCKSIQMCVKLHAQMKLLARFFPTQLPVFDQDMWLYYMCLKQHFFSSVFFRFSLMLLFVWFPWLASIYKNSFFSFLSRFALLTLDLSSEAAT